MSEELEKIYAHERGQFKELQMKIKVRCSCLGFPNPLTIFDPLMKSEAEIERKQYATCLDHADKLELLASQWGSAGAGILTRTLEDEAQLVITEALDLCDGEHPGPKKTTKS